MEIQVDMGLYVRLAGHSDGTGEGGWRGLQDTYPEKWIFPAELLPPLVGGMCVDAAV